jgi:tetratricopeptide (TPR) repeat protein
VHTAGNAPGWSSDNTSPVRALPGVQVEQLATAADLGAWLRAEHLVLLRAIAQAAAVGSASHAWRIFSHLSQILAQDGHWADWEAAGAIALDAAAKAADYQGLGRVHGSIARRAYVRGARATANEHYLKMLDLCHLAGDVLGQAQAHIFIAQSVRTRGHGVRAPVEPDTDDVRAGLAHAEQAAVLFRQVGQRHGEGLALTAMARFHIVLNSHELARGYALRALDLQRSVDNPQWQAHALHALGDLHRSIGEFSDAVHYHHQALDIPVTFSTYLHWYRAVMLTDLGDTQLAAADRDAARQAWQQAVELLDNLRHPLADKVRARLQSNDDNHGAAVLS